LNKSSKAWRALDVPLPPPFAPPLPPPLKDVVSRSTVVRGSYIAHVLRMSFGETRAGTCFWHSNAALVSKEVHCAHECMWAPHRPHVPSALQAAATVSSLPHRAQRTTSRKPGMLNVRGAIGGCPRGVYSFFSAGFCSRRGSRASSW
jgi:hypothetical protein